MQKKNSIHLFVLSLFVVLSTLISRGQQIDLSGEWKFALDAENTGVEQQLFNSSLSDRFRLPGSNVENLKGFDISLDTRFTGSIYDSSWYYNPHMEKYRRQGNIKVPFWLTQQKYYTGLAWYQREIEIPVSWSGKQIELYLERVHSVSQVWIDGNPAGSANSLNTPHVFDLTPFVKSGKRYKLTICVDNRLKTLDVGANSHSVTDHTQGNWNGIVGKIALIARNPLHAVDVQVCADLKNKLARIKFDVSNLTKKPANAMIYVEAKSFNAEVTHAFANCTSFRFKAGESSRTIEMELVLGDKMQTWDEFSPALYQLKVIVAGKEGRDTVSTQFGMREISIAGKWIYVNGRKTMMRGTVENALFPLTGYPPTDVPSWERVFRICKAYGLNHMRFHSNCPPEAAFKAADLVGIYLQPEGPSWPNHSTQLGRGLPIDTYLMEETKRMTKFYGNYASFVMMAAGNEPRGNWVPWVSRFVDYWKSTDPRRIYTGASVGGSWSWQPNNQYHVKAGARGLDWGRGGPESMSDFRNRIDTVSQPFISHETGQWCAFPDFEEIKKYTGVTRAKNFELFKEELDSNDMGHLSREFLMASGKLQLLCYKHEIEKTLRTPGYAGFQLLSLNDFSGQGTALVGVLNAFWEEKGYASEQDFTKFCNSTVPLIRTQKFVYKQNEKLIASVEIAHFGPQELKKSNILLKISSKSGDLLHQEVLSNIDIPIGNNIPAGNIQFDLSSFSKATQLNLEISIEGTHYHNDWNFWVYPDNQESKPAGDVYITRTLDDEARKKLSEGGKVLLLAAGNVVYGKDVVQYFTPVFWNTSWFKMRPPHTTGVYIRNTHPVFKNFITDNWADLQWWELVNRAQTMLLTDFPKGFQPIVQPIDTWFINRKLGMLLEARVGNGKLMMTSMVLNPENEDRPVAKAMYNAILDYMQSAEFNPEFSVDIQQISDIFSKEAEPYNFYSKSSPDELKQGKI